MVFAFIKGMTQQGLSYLFKMWSRAKGCRSFRHLTSLIRSLKTIAVLLTILSVVPAQAKILYSYYNLKPQSSSAKVTKRPLILWLHGCRQSQKKFVEYSQIVEKTRSLNPIILAPTPDTEGPTMNCWNFLSGEMKSRSGKLMEVVSEIRKHIASGVVDANRVYVGGFSSGAVFANRLVMCFPDVFKGALIHSGAPFELSNSFSGSQAAKEESVVDALRCSSGAKYNRLKTLVFVHGTVDPVLPYFLGLNAFKQSVAYLNYLDNGTINKSAIDKYEKSQNQIDVTFSNKSSAHFLKVEGMSHRWSGSKPGAAFSSPNTESAVDLFLKLTGQLR